jgi:hypothetical protein
MTELSSIEIVYEQNIIGKPEKGKKRYNKMTSAATCFYNLTEFFLIARTKVE